MDEDLLDLILTDASDEVEETSSEIDSTFEHVSPQFPGQSMDPPTSMTTLSPDGKPEMADHELNEPSSVPPVGRPMNEGEEVSTSSEAENLFDSFLNEVNHTSEELITEAYNSITPEEDTAPRTSPKKKDEGCGESGDEVEQSSGERPTKRQRCSEGIADRVGSSANADCQPIIVKPKLPKEEKEEMLRCLEEKLGAEVNFAKKGCNQPRQVAARGGGNQNQVAQERAKPSRVDGRIDSYRGGGDEGRWYEDGGGAGAEANIRSSEEGCQEEGISHPCWRLVGGLL